MTHRRNAHSEFEAHLSGAYRPIRPLSAEILIPVIEVSSEEPDLGSRGHARAA